MFRLLKSGLPKDPIFPADLEGLGYFTNDEDEVRMITNPRAYFNFFLTKNDRHNSVQREAMNGCLREEVLDRLYNIDLETVRLPLGAEETEPHIPILVTSNIFEKQRVIILFYEHTQDLGVFAYRIIGGRGGINAGSAVDFVKYIQNLRGANSEDSPGVIIANLGQLRWWRRGKKAVTHTTWFSLPQKSAVSGAYRFDALKNTVPENRNTTEHVAYIFNHVVPNLLAPDAMLEVIGVSVGAVEVVDFLNKPQNWAIMEPRLTALALIATFHRRDDINNPWFADWLRKRGRAYIISAKPPSTPLAPSNGNSHTDPDDNTTTTSDCYGCPVYSLGEPYYSEVMLPKGYKIVLDWFQEAVAGGEEYENPEVVIKKDIHREEESGEYAKCGEEPQDADVKIGGLKSERRTGEEVEVHEAQAEDVNGEQAGIEELNVGRPNVAELSIKDSYIQEIRDAECNSLMDWGEDVREEEIKKKGHKSMDHSDPEAAAEKRKEQRVKEGQPGIEDTNIHKFNIIGSKVQGLNLGDLKVDTPDKCADKEEIPSEEATKAHDLTTIRAESKEAEIEKKDVNKEKARYVAIEDENEDYDFKIEEVLKVVGHTDQEIKIYKEGVAKRAIAKEEGSKVMNANEEHLEIEELDKEEAKPGKANVGEFKVGEFNIENPKEREVNEEGFMMKMEEEEYDFSHSDHMICECERPYIMELPISSDFSDRDTEEQFTATNASL